MKKTYCIVSAQYFPTVGGVETYTFNLAKELIKKGHNCIVITSSVKNTPKIETTPEGIKILRLKGLSLVNGRLPIAFFSKENISLLNTVLENENIHFIINTRIYLLSLLCSAFAKKHKLPCIVIEHGSNYLSLNNKFLDVFIRIYEHILIKLIYMNCKNFYGVSKACCKWLKHFNVKAKGILYNAISADYIYNIDKHELDLSPYNIDANSKKICYVGRLVPEKGVENLLKAFNELNLENTVLLFAGEGASYNYLYNNKNENTFLLGQIAYRQAISLYKQSDIFCLPTISEGFPTTVLEACLCGCIVATTMQSGGATEIILDSEHGILMEDNSVDSIKKALMTALTDENFNQKIDNAKQRVLENFLWHITANQILEMNFEA